MTDPPAAPAPAAVTPRRRGGRLRLLSVPVARGLSVVVYLRICRLRLLFVPVALAALAGDLWSKAAMFAEFDCGVDDVQIIRAPDGALFAQVIEPTPDHFTRRVIDGVFHFRAAWNSGSAFGLFSGASILLLVVSSAALLVLGWLLWTAPPGWRAPVAIGLVGGGALGNLYDRLTFVVAAPDGGERVGLVRDFCLFVPKIPIIDRQWAVFNLADTFIVVGVGFMFLDLLLAGRRARREAAAGAGT